MLNVYFWNKNENMFQIDLNTLFAPVMPGSWTSLICRNVPEYGQICRDMRNFVNIPEYAWNIPCLNEPEF